MKGMTEVVQVRIAGTLIASVQGVERAWIVPAMEVFEAVSQGTVQIGHGAAYYWKGKVPIAQFFTAIPFGLTAQEMNGWLIHGGGLELWTELYDRFDLVPIPGGNTGVQMAGWFNKEINSIADIQGMKMRIPGRGGEVFSRAGGETVQTPGGEIFTSLQTGVIDAAEWVGPYNDYFMKFYEAAKFYYTGGMHEPGSCLGMGFNASFWGKLSKTEQALITAACMEEHAAQYEETCAKNGEYLEKLVKDHGTKVKSFNDDVWDAFGEAAAEVFEETRAHSAMAKKVDDAYQGFMKECGTMMANFEISYVNQRNRVLDIS